MERRKFVIGAGALATGSAAAMGTGAFSTAQTGDRDMEVDVAGDAEAYLSLRPTETDEPGENGHYAHIDDDGMLYVSFTDETGEFYDDFDSPNEGDGINPDSTYTFDSVFEIQNQGPNTGGSQGEIDLTVERTDGSDRFSLYWSEASPDSDEGTPTSNATSVSPGEAHKVGIEVDGSDLVEGDSRSATFEVTGVNQNAPVGGD